MLELSPRISPNYPQPKSRTGGPCKGQAWNHWSRKFDQAPKMAGFNF